MEYSFYGGRPGKSFVIAKTFDSYKTMEENFAQGLNYQEVVYGEYVLINTSDPRNIENGKLYKRGYEGPEYIGTIEGPPGYSPHVQVRHFNEVNNSGNISDKNKSYLFSEGEMTIGSADDGNKDEVKDLVPGNLFKTIKWKTLSCRMVTSFFYGENDNEILKVPIDSIRQHRRYVSLKQAESVPDDSEAETQNMISVKEFFYDEEGFYTETSETGTINGIQFIRKAVDGLENGATASILKTTADNIEKKSPSVIYVEDNNKLKEIKYSYEEQAEETVADIAFQFPYYVFNWEANSISPYGEERADSKKVFEQPVAYENLINDEDKEYPFYSDMKLKVPQGIKGDSLKGLKVITGAEYSARRTEEAKTSGITSHSQWTDEDTYVNGKLQDDAERQILVYEYYDYRNDPNGTKITKYLGDYNMIESVSLNTDNGTLTIQYTHDNTYTAQLDWVKNVNFQDGILTFDKTVSGDVVCIIKYVTDIDIEQENGDVHFTYNTKDENGQNEKSVIQNALKYIKEMDIQPNSSDIKMTYSTYDTETKIHDTKILTNILRYAKDIQISQDGIVTLTWTTKTNGQDDTTTLENKLKWAEDVSIESDGDVVIKYNTKSADGINDTEVKNKLKWTEDMSVADNGDLTITYNNDTKIEEGKIKWIKEIKVDENFQLQVKYNNDEKFFNLGSTKIDSTLSIAFNISKDVAGTTVENNLKYLNDNYPNGLTVDATGNTVDSAWMKGKIVTVGSTSDLEADNNKLFYAFDYSLNSDNSYKGWYCLGSIGEASPDEVYGMAFTESEANTKLNELRPGAVCFLVTEVPE